MEGDRMQLEPTVDEVRRVFGALVSKLRSAIDQHPNPEYRAMKNRHLDLAAAAIDRETDSNEMKEVFLSAMAVFYRWPSLQTVWSKITDTDLEPEMIFRSGRGHSSSPGLID
jgi:hypothetical protein